MPFSTCLSPSSQRFQVGPNKPIRYALTLVLLAPVFCYALPLVAAAPVRPISVVVVEEKPVSLDEYVQRYAIRYGVSADDMWRVIRCENPSLDPMQQSNARYTRNHPEWGVVAGQRELSYGVAQIHLPTAGGVTYEQATDMEFSVEWMAKRFSEGKQHLWSCW